MPLSAADKSKIRGKVLGEITQYLNDQDGERLKAHKAKLAAPKEPAVDEDEDAKKLRALKAEMGE